MAPESMVHATQAWLRSSWHIQVPFAWLEACLEWLLEDAGGSGRPSQQQINQQAMDQWLLTDLRDLDFAILPEGLARAQKTQLRGTFCVQVDSLLDVSQPAYTQLQKRRGTQCGNDEVSAVTQYTQRPWEAKPTRMLLMQVTDGVQTLEAMEYQPIAALSTELRPGVKLQLSGEMTCRLGVLLLEPGNIKVLGGEVEDLSDRNNQGRMLCRTLGIPEEEEAPPGQEVDDLDDQELLATLEAQDEREVAPAQTPADSGYRTLSETRSFMSNTSSRNDSMTSSHRSSVNRTPGHNNNTREEEVFNSADPPPSSIDDQHMGDEDFPEDFDDLPLDELEMIMTQENEQTASTGSNGTGRGNDSSGSERPGSGPAEPPGSGRFSSGSGMTSDVPHGADIPDDDLMEEDMDCFPVEAKKNEAKPSTSAGYHVSSTSAKPPNEAPGGFTLSSTPFTYLSLLEKPSNTRGLEIRVKAFIVTLLGKLSSGAGLWRVGATISDGTGYLDVELSDQVLRGLLGFSVAEKSALKRDPGRRGQLAAGMKRCQEELVDMCCLMTVEIGADEKNAVVTKAEPVSEKMLQELERRVKDGRK